MIKNILFSTTRQFNIGDEAILFGVLNLFDQCIGRDMYNPIIYNRNPDIRLGTRCSSFLKTKRVTNARIRGRSYLKCIFSMDFFDNSIKDDSDFRNIDMVVFAGTPEWYGLRLKVLYKKIKKYNIPCIFIGIGVGEKVTYNILTSLEKYALKNAVMITVRDSYTYELLREYNARKLACPALLSFGGECRTVEQVNKVGLIYSSSSISVNNRISEKTYEYLKILYKELMKIFNIELICHYVDEIDEIVKDFPTSTYRYSYNSADYYDIYKKYDLVIGCRVHGIGIAASMGIPGVIIKHDMRGDTANAFGAKSICPDIQLISHHIQQILEMAHEIRKYSLYIINQKEKVQKEYKKILIPILKEQY